MHRPLKLIKFLRLFGSILVLMTFLPSPVYASWNKSQNPSISNLQSQSPGNLAGGKTIEILADTYGLPLSTDDIAGVYGKPSVLLNQNDKVNFKVLIDLEGSYTISFDMTASETYINPPEGQLLVDGEYTSNGAQSFVFPIYYKNTTDTFPLDRYGNEALIRQESMVHWSKVAMRDANFSQKYPVQIQLTKGEHNFEFNVTRESMY